MDKKKIERIIMMVMLVLVVFAAGYFGVFQGQWEKRTKLRRDSVVLDKDLADAQRLKKSLPSEQQKAAQLTGKMAEMDKYIISGGEFSEFVTAIKSAADKAGLELKNVRPVLGAKDIQRGPGYVERWISVDVLAKYHVIADALAHLEVDAPSVRVVEYKLNSSQDSSGIHPAQFTLGFIVKPEK